VANNPTTKYQKRTAHIYDYENYVVIVSNPTKDLRADIW